MVGGGDADAAGEDDALGSCAIALKQTKQIIEQNLAEIIGHHRIASSTGNMSGVQSNDGSSIVGANPAANRYASPMIEGPKQNENQYRGKRLGTERD